MKDLFAEFTRLINKAFPTVVVIIIMTITLLLQLILVSRLDNLEISSAIGFANSLCLCLVLYLMLSINQSFMARLSFYKGQGNKHKMKLTVYQSILILLVVGLVLFLILAYIVPLA